MSADLIKRLRDLSAWRGIKLADEAVDALEQQAATIERLTAENDALRADAEQYRWLRDVATSEDWRWLASLSPAETDAAINDARKAAAQGCGCQPGTCESKPTGCRMAEEVKLGSGVQ